MTGCQFNQGIEKEHKFFFYMPTNSWTYFIFRPQSLLKMKRHNTKLGIPICWRMLKCFDTSIKINTCGSVWFDFYYITSVYFICALFSFSGPHDEEGIMNFWSSISSRLLRRKIFDPVAEEGNTKLGMCYMLRTFKD